MRCQIVSVIMLPFPPEHLPLWSVWHFTCSDADGEIYLLMENSRLPICQLCLSIDCCSGLQQTEHRDRVRDPQTWKGWPHFGREMKETLPIRNKTKPLRDSLGICAWGYVGTQEPISLAPFIKGHPGCVPCLLSWDSGPFFWAIPVPYVALLPDTILGNTYFGNCGEPPSQAPPNYPLSWRVSPVMNQGLLVTLLSYPWVP